MQYLIKAEPCLPSTSGRDADVAFAPPQKRILTHADLDRYIAGSGIAAVHPISSQSLPAVAKTGGLTLFVFALFSVSCSLAEFLRLYYMLSSALLPPVKRPCPGSWARPLPRILWPSSSRSVRLAEGKSCRNPAAPRQLSRHLERLLGTLDGWIDEIPPVQHSVRYGNPAFRHIPHCV